MDLVIESVHSKPFVEAALGDERNAPGTGSRSSVYYGIITIYVPEQWWYSLFIDPLVNYRSPVGLTVVYN